MVLPIIVIMLKLQWLTLLVWWLLLNLIPSLTENKIANNNNCLIINIIIIFFKPTLLDYFSKRRWHLSKNISFDSQYCVSKMPRCISLYVDAVSHSLLNIVLVYYPDVFRYMLNVISHSILNSVLVKYLDVFSYMSNVICSYKIYVLSNYCQITCDNLQIWWKVQWGNIRTTST